MLLNSYYLLILNSILLQAIKRRDFASDEERNLICLVSKVNFDSYSSAAKWLLLWQKSNWLEIKLCFLGHMPSGDLVDQNVD